MDNMMCHIIVVMCFLAASNILCLMYCIHNSKVMDKIGEYTDIQFIEVHEVHQNVTSEDGAVYRIIAYNRENKIVTEFCCPVLMSHKNNIHA